MTWHDKTNDQEPEQCEERKDCARGVGHRCLHDLGHAGECVFTTCEHCRTAPRPRCLMCSTPVPPPFKLYCCGECQEEGQR